MFYFSEINVIVFANMKRLVGSLTTLNRVIQLMKINGVSYLKIDGIEIRTDVVEPESRPMTDKEMATEFDKDLYHSAS